MTRSAFAVAERFKHAIEAKARERERYCKADVVHYNVFVITGKPLLLPTRVAHLSPSNSALPPTEPFSEFEAHHPHLVAWDSNGNPTNYVDFAVREREEMCNLTQATEVTDGVWVRAPPSLDKWNGPIRLTLICSIARQL